MYTVQADTNTGSVVFGPPMRSRSSGDWPVFTLSPRQADNLAHQLRQAANALRWAKAPAFAVGQGEQITYHLAAPQDRSQALSTAALCDKAPEGKWSSIRPLEKIDVDDPLLCPVCAARWQETYP
ncbi:MAG: hypothetical protein U0X20_17265 [Caldilineaceae bacterium]